jgi:hypothetical protein
MPTRSVKSKTPVNSKTLWFNVLSLAVITAEFLAGQPLIGEYPQVAYWFGVVVVVGNTILRLITTQPLEMER